MKMTEYCIFDSKDTDNAIHRTIIEINEAVIKRLIIAIEDENSPINDLHPQKIITMTCTNIIMALLIPCINKSISIKQRKQMVQETLEEITEMTMELWKASEALKADVKNEH